MNEIKIYEPAMCCPTGLCGANVNPELLRVSTIINTLQKKGAKITRYNLSSSPKAFIENKEINEIIKQGTDSLPITILNGQIVKTKNYPTNEEFLNWLEINLDGNNSNNSKGCNCSGGCC